MLGQRARRAHGGLHRAARQGRDEAHSPDGTNLGQPFPYTKDYHRDPHEVERDRVTPP